MAFKKGAAPTDLNRYMELLQQNALCLCLNDNIADALSFINNSIELGEQIHNTFLTIKAMTLKSTIYAYNQDYKNAINILKATNFTHTFHNAILVSFSNSLCRSDYFNMIAKSLNTNSFS